MLLIIKMMLIKLTIILTVLSLCSYLAFFLWIVIGICFIFFKSKDLFNRATTILFIIGVLGFFIFRYIFPDVFGWVLD